MDEASFTTFQYYDFIFKVVASSLIVLWALVMIINIISTIWYSRLVWPLTLMAPTAEEIEVMRQYREQRRMNGEDDDDVIPFIGG